MRILLDQNLSAAIVDSLRDLGIDAVATYPHASFAESRND